jgi:hypothetical protein
MKLAAWEINWSGSLFDPAPRGAPAAASPVPALPARCPASLRAKIEADIGREARTVALDDYRRRAALVANPDPERPDREREVTEEERRAFAYCDEIGLFGEDAAAAAELSREDRAFAFSAHGEFLALCKERTGDILPDDVLAKSRARAAEILRQSVEIADKMREAGFQCYRETPFELTRYFVHSREVECLPSFRRICFIPVVAQACRGPILAALEFFLSCNPFCRFWTFTSGLRVKLSGVRDRAQWLAAKIKELNRQKFMREAGVRIVFRTTELGTPETDESGNVRDGGEIERDEDGQLYFHVHAHCVVEMAGGFIAPEKWSALVAKVGKFWPYWWGEGGAVRSAKECCKYVTKPGEMTKLSGAELVELQSQLSRLKLVQPMGSLAAEIKAREAAGKRLVKRETKEGRVFFAVRNWNKHTRRTSAEAAQDAVGRITAKPARREFRVVSRGTPRFGAAGVAEPVVTVMGIRGTWNESAVRAHPLVAPLIRATVHQFDAGAAMKRAGAAVGISVHTRTPTAEPVPAGPAEWSEDRRRKRPKFLHRAPVGASSKGF